MNEISLSAIGADRPGIVAALTGVLAELGCSIEDSAMEVLRSQFAVMLVLDAPAGVSASSLEASLANIASEYGLVVAARPLASVAEPDAAPAGSSGHYGIAVHGADRPGIVHGVASVLSTADANIVELRTHVAGDAENPLYVMAMEVAVPAATDVAALSSALEAAARELGITVTMTPSDDDLL